MKTELDHLVVAGTDLSAMVAWWAASSGRQPSTGGTHVGFGTRNALVGLGDAYIELIGPDPEQDEPSRPRPFGIDELPAGSIQLVTFALAVEDLDASLEAMAANDVPFGQAQAMLRLKPDGSLLEWRLALPVGFDGVMPFLIEWGPDAEHPSASLPGDCRLVELVGHHPDAARLSPGLEAIDAPFTIEPGDRPSLAATVMTPNGLIEL